MIRGALPVGVLAACSGKGAVRSGGEAGVGRDAAIANVAAAPDAQRCPRATEDVDGEYVETEAGRYFGPPEKH